MKGMRVNRSLRVQEFAEIAGVTVRALHHYDRLALLRPRRTDAGYRLYSMRDLERLEQIVALKFLGFPLKRIKDVLDQDRRDLSDVLRSQRRALEQKRRRLDQAIHAIGEAEETIRKGQQPDAAALKKIIEVIEMQDNADFMMKYYSEDAQAKMAKRREEWNPELQERATKAWKDLFRDVEAALGEDPRSPKAQALAARWRKLVEEFTGGDPGIRAGLKKAWSDRQHWPEHLQQKTAPFSDPRVWEFIGKAMNCREG